MVSPRRCESLAIVVPSFRPQNKTQKALRFPITETGGLCSLYWCFLKPSRNTLRGFLIAAWAGDKIAEFSFPEILFHFPLRPWFFFVSPRVCGEKPLRKRVCSSALGSPPRMRGKVGDHAVIGVHHRSTPAHAGKSHCSRRRATALRDHPRVCGEKGMFTLRRTADTGSPPRMRGKVDVVQVCKLGDRITPAYAGKRSERSRIF